MFYRPADLALRDLSGRGEAPEGEVSLRKNERISELEVELLVLRVELREKSALVDTLVLSVIRAAREVTPVLRGAILDVLEAEVPGVEIPPELRTRRS